MSLRNIWLAVAAGVMLAACGGLGDGPVPVPRPRAYPRISLYPSAYSPHEVCGLSLMVNDSARVSVRDNWIDISYPAYGISVSATVTPVTDATLGEVMRNRSERMALNAGSAYGELTQFTSRSGFTAALLETSPGSGLTPLQFLATDSAGYVLSGAAIINGGGTVATDSLRPAIDALRADLVNMLQAL